MKYYLVFGAFFLVWSALSVFFPSLVCGKDLQKELESRPERKKRYILHQRINILALGLVLGAAEYLPENLLLPVTLTELALVCASVLWCNKSNLGRWYVRNVAARRSIFRK